MNNKPSPLVLGSGNETPIEIFDKLPVPYTYTISSPITDFIHYEYIADREQRIKTP